MAGLQKGFDLNKYAVKDCPINTDRYQFPTRVPKEMIDRAYEVYCELYGSNENKIDESSDNYIGFTVGDLLVLLYVYTFPKKDWNDRYLEAGRGLKWV